MYRLPLFLSVLSAWACDCAYAPPCAMFNGTDVIFVGQALGEDAARGAFRFKIEEIYKGLDPSQSATEFTVVEMPGCAPGFVSGKRYLVMAKRWDDGMPFASACGGSRRIEDAGNDVALLRLLAKDASLARLQGRTAANIDEEFIEYDLQSEHKSGLPNVEVVATKDDKSYKESSDDKGWFQIDVPGSGTYSVTARLPGYSSRKPSYQLEVETGNCAEQDIGMWTDSLVSGHLFGDDGRPAAGVRVEIEGFGKAEFAGRIAVTDDRGRYQFTKVPVGEYLIGVSPQGIYAQSPYDPVFYPGVSQRESALPVKVDGPAEVKDVDFHIGKRHGTRRIVVNATWSDGKPVTNLSISFSRSQSRRFITRFTDPKGEAAFEALAEADYRVRADRLVWSNAMRPVRSPAARAGIPVPAGTEMLRVLLVLDRAEDFSQNEEPVDMSPYNGEIPDTHPL